MGYKYKVKLLKALCILCVSLNGNAIGQAVCYIKCAGN